jgi:hypothetical protein
LSARNFFSFTAYTLFGWGGGGKALLPYASILPVSKSKNDHVGSDTNRISYHPVICLYTWICVCARETERKEDKYSERVKSYRFKQAYKYSVWQIS